MIIREDDFDPRYSLEQVKEVHELFLKYDMMHTTALNVMRGERYGIGPEVVDYIKSTKNWDIQLHGWDHEEYHKWPYHTVIRDLYAGIAYIERVFGKRPIIFYPPWNGDSEHIKRACDEAGIQLSNNAVYIRHYLQKPEKYKDQNIIYFHSWERPCIDALEPLFKLLKGETTVEPRDIGTLDKPKDSKGRIALNQYIVPRFASFFKSMDRIINIGKHRYWDYKPFFNNPKLLCYYENLDSDSKEGSEIVADIQQCPQIESESINGIMMIGVYESLERPKDAFSEMHRIIKPGGKIMIAFPGVGYQYGNITMMSWVNDLELFRIDESYFYYDNDKDVSSICVIATKRIK